jgi:hypothetical protein
MAAANHEITKFTKFTKTTWPDFVSFVCLRSWLSDAARSYSNSGAVVSGLYRFITV